jgi:hypothetical protein
LFREVTLRVLRTHRAQMYKLHRWIVEGGTVGNRGAGEGSEPNHQSYRKREGASLDRITSTHWACVEVQGYTFPPKSSSAIKELFS